MFWGEISRKYSDNKNCRSYKKVGQRSSFCVPQGKVEVIQIDLGQSESCHNSIVRWSAKRELNQINQSYTFALNQMLWLVKFKVLLKNYLKSLYEKKKNGYWKSGDHFMLYVPVAL